MPDGMKMGDLRRWMAENTMVPDDERLLGTLVEFPIDWARGNPLYTNDLIEVTHQWEMPDGLCSNRDDHPAHEVLTGSLAPFWCTADQSKREPWRSEQRRRQTEGK